MIRVTDFYRANGRDEDRAGARAIERLMRRVDAVPSRDRDTVEMRSDAFVDPAQLQQAHVRRAHEHRAQVPKMCRLFDVLHHDDRVRRALGTRWRCASCVGRRVQGSHPALDMRRAALRSFMLNALSPSFWLNDISARRGRMLHNDSILIEIDATGK